MMITLSVSEICQIVMAVAAIIALFRGNKKK